jgi:hypothetical protein
MLHPALAQLLRAQTSAKWRRLRRTCSTRRRLFLSVLAALLAVIWCGNVVMSILLRQPTAPERFERMVPMGLAVYAVWHVLKTAFKRPEEAIEWTPAEREFVCAGPFERHQLIFYRLASILNATLAKATCFTLLMLPDLRQPWGGWVGMFLALVFLDLLRLNVEITTHGLATRTYRAFRGATAALSTTVVVSSLVIAFSTPPNWHAQSTHLTWAILRHILGASAQLFDTLPGRVALAPFQMFAHLIVASELSAAWWSNLGVCVAVVAGMIGVVIYLDRWFAQRMLERLRRDYPPRPREATHPAQPTARPSARHRVAWLVGVGPIAWRQLIGANRQRSQLAVALALPGLLAMLPVFVCSNGRQAALQVSAALTFYSFLLLPSALRFDFRRDILRMAVLKTLPIPPLAVVIGQIATPTLLAFGFQTVVLTATLIVRPFPIWMFVATLVLLAPLSALIFAIDNLVYLLYPYRLNQEGIEIFLRTTLTFTAKGLIFTGGLLVTFFWSFIAHQMALRLPSPLSDPALVFVLGGWTLLCLATWLVVQLLARSFVRFDPSQDTPA